MPALEQWKCLAKESKMCYKKIFVFLALGGVGAGREVDGKPCPSDGWEASCDVVGATWVSACGSPSSVTQQTGESQLNYLGVLGRTCPS